MLATLSCWVDHGWKMTRFPMIGVQTWLPQNAMELLKLLLALKKMDHNTKTPLNIPFLWHE